MSSIPGSGGLTTTPEMLKILSRQGYISVPDGGQRLRDLYRKRMNISIRAVFILTAHPSDSSTFNSQLLSPFGFACYFADFSTVQRVSSLSVCHYRRNIKSGLSP